MFMLAVSRLARVPPPPGACSTTSHRPAARSAARAWQSSTRPVTPGSGGFAVDQVGIFGRNLRNHRQRVICGEHPITRLQRRLGGFRERLDLAARFVRQIGDPTDRGLQVCIRLGCRWLLCRSRCLLRHVMYFE